MVIDSDKYFIHSNAWWWGVGCRIIRRDGAGIVGINFDNSMPETCYIEGLSVVENERGKGIGRSLLELCEVIARQEGKTFLSLSAEKDRQWLVEWYKRMGFCIYSIEDHTFLMIKCLK